MNDVLKRLLDSGDITSKRTLQFVVDNELVAYTTQYEMNGLLGPFKWYLTWKAETCNDKQKLQYAGIFIHDARARLFFPGYLDCRIPPEHGLMVPMILKLYHVEEYDKFNLIVATKADNVVFAGHVYETCPRDCPLDVIDRIEDVWKEYTRTLEDS